MWSLRPRARVPAPVSQELLQKIRDLEQKLSELAARRGVPFRRGVQDPRGVELARRSRNREAGVESSVGHLGRHNRFGTGGSTR